VPVGFLRLGRPDLPALPGRYQVLRVPGTANFGGIDALKSSQKILTWHHPAIDWVKGCIAAAVTDLTRAELGEAADEITHGVQVEGWAVVYREGGSLRPHRHHDSAWFPESRSVPRRPAAVRLGWMPSALG
jgi:hypothetical protein